MQSGATTQLSRPKEGEACHDTPRCPSVCSNGRLILLMSIAYGAPVLYNKGLMAILLTTIAYGDRISYTNSLSLNTKSLSEELFSHVTKLGFSLLS